jgi:hypothetical protein
LSFCLPYLWFCGRPIFVATNIIATHPSLKIEISQAALDVPTRCPWVSGRAGEAPAYAGTDFIIAREGRIAAIYLFFDKLI